MPIFVTEGNVTWKNYAEAKSQVAQKGTDVAIFAVGSMFETGKKAVAQLAEKGIVATLVNPVFVSGVDKQLVDDLKTNHKLFVTLEEGILEGGFGQKIASYLGDSDVKVKNFGLEKSFFGDFDPHQLLAENGLTAQSVVSYVEKALQK